MNPINERECINYPTTDRLSGFTDRYINRLTTHKPTPTMLTIESNHLKRELNRDPKNITPLLEYQLWLEAGKLDKMNFKSLEGDNKITYNSNLWRNFRNSAGLLSNRKGTVSESISTLYPINIPSPSQIGPYTLAKYYQENKNSLFKSDKTYNVAVAKVENEATLMKYLRLKSEMRNPPLDWNGNILPPKNFKRYQPLGIFDSLSSNETDKYQLKNNRETDNDMYIKTKMSENFLNIKKSNSFITLQPINNSNLNKFNFEQQVKADEAKL